MGVKRQPRHSKFLFVRFRPNAFTHCYAALHYTADSMFTGLNVSEKAWLDEGNDLCAWRTEYGGWRSIKENEHKVSCCETSGAMKKNLQPFSFSVEPDFDGGVLRDKVSGYERQGAG